MTSRARRTSAAVAALAAVSAVAVPAAASAAVDQNPCGYTPLKLFTAWNDNRGYVLTPDGGFEGGGSGWTLENGAAVGEGNETFQLGGAADHQSLTLPAGSSATSPAVCVTRHTGIFRFFARNGGVPEGTVVHGNKEPQLKVEVLYTGKHGNHRSLRVGKLRAGDTWAPTRKLPIVLGQAKGKGKLQKANVQLRFTPIGTATEWQIDDVYLDPRLRH